MFIDVPLSKHKCILEIGLQFLVPTKPRQAKTKTEKWGRSNIMSIISEIK